MRQPASITDPYPMQTRCLIVDDNSLFLDAATELLDREGVDVVATASTSTDAIRLVGELRPDVALVDIDLGQEDGFELARRLSNGQPASAKVILVSTHSGEELGELIAASPALGFIPKTRLSAQAILDLLDGS
jgi:DNA-binding NarL/FixJ family response regulator